MGKHLGCRIWSTWQRKRGDLKAEIGIPEDAVVFGWHGGDDSFDILWVQKPWLKPLEINPKSGFCF